MVFDKKIKKCVNKKMQFKALGFEKMKTSTLILLYCILYSAHVNSNNQIIKLDQWLNALSDSQN